MNKLIEKAKQIDAESSRAGRNPLMDTIEYAELIVGYVRKELRASSISQVTDVESGTIISSVAGTLRHAFDKGWIEIKMK